MYLKSESSPWSGTLLDFNGLSGFATPMGVIAITAQEWAAKARCLSMPVPDPSGLPGTKSESETSSLLKFLHQHGHRVNLKTGEILFLEGNPCKGTYFVEEGAIEFTISSVDRKIHVGRARPGHLLGISSVLTNSPIQSTATAEVESKLIFVPAEIIREYLKSNAELCLHAVQLLGSEIVDLSSNAIRPLRLRPRYPKPNY